MTPDTQLKGRPSANQEFKPSKKAQQIMREGDIIGKDETPKEMLERVAGIIPEIETEHFNTSKSETLQFADTFLKQMLNRKIVPSTPIQTNAGRFKERPLSACSNPPVDLNNNPSEIKEKVDTYHEQGMGTGFQLDEADNKPLETLLDLQKWARQGLEQDEQHRPVGNMGIMRVDNPKIREFIKIKQENQEIDWKFNLSVNITDSFMQAYSNGENFQLTDGTQVDAQELMDLMVKCAWDCADPGLIFLNNMNDRRPFEESLEYGTVAPCGEVGLAKGETCQFASINIAEFTDGEQIHWDELKDTVAIVTRFLDDVLEHSLHRYDYTESEDAMRKSRKIGVGYCGYSKLLTRLGLKYGSSEANQVLKDTLSFINYHSKKHSIRLAEERGNFEGWEESKYSSQDRNFLTEKFGDKESRKISKQDWKELDREIRENGLRNSTTVILPPTGRSALTFDTSQQIEPIFSLCDRYGDINEEFKQFFPSTKFDQIREEVEETGSCQHLDIPVQVKEIFRTATEIPYNEHFDVLVEAQAFVDESVSKTINLPQDAPPEAVEKVYRKAYSAGLNGMTVYRNGSHSEQPMDLKNEEAEDAETVKLEDE